MEDILNTLKINIIIAHSALLDKNWDYTGVNDFFSRIYYIQKGEGFAIHHNKKFQLKPGRLYLIPPYSNARMYCPDSLMQYWTHFNATVLIGINLFSILTPEYEVRLENDSSVLKMFDDLKLRFKSKDTVQKYEADSILRYFISLFIKNSAFDTDKVNSIIRFEKVLTFIEDNLNRQLNLKELASQAFLHPTYFSNLFCKFIGMPPLRYINTKRAEKAKMLLFSTDDSVEQISEKVGFMDAFYFSRIFKKLTGQSPAQYRKKTRKYLS